MTRNLTTEEAKEIGRKGGLSKSEKKQASSRNNGKLGGRPKKERGKV
jgi:general stress protein YciG